MSVCVLHVATFQVCALDSKHSSRMTVPIHPAYQPAAQKHWVTEWPQRKMQGVQGTAPGKSPRARSDLQGGESSCLHLSCGPWGWNQDQDTGVELFQSSSSGKENLSALHSIIGLYTQSFSSSD